MAASPRSQQWYGPHGQWYPHRVIFQFFHALGKAIANTLAGLCIFLLHPIRSCSDIKWALTHIGETVHTLKERAFRALREQGIVFTGTSALCMVFLPGAGLFGKLADLSEAGRKAKAGRPVTGTSSGGPGAGRR